MNRQVIIQLWTVKFSSAVFQTLNFDLPDRKVSEKDGAMYPKLLHILRSVLNCEVGRASCVELPI